jgi:hypothetical protein
MKMVPLQLNNEGAARGREAHKRWQPPPEFKTCFQFNSRLKLDAINFNTQQL